MNTVQSTKPLWATIGGLVVAVGALGGVLIHQHFSNPAAAAQPRPPTLPAVEPVRAPADLKPAALASAPPPPDREAAPVAPAMPLAPVSPVASAAPATPMAPPVAQVAQAAPPAPAPRRICAICGHVESVRTVQHAAPTTGVGAVAGGVIGGVVGNQFGHGSGRAATTILGAVGGGFLGNHIEKRTRTVTAYEVRVRMDDGSLRHVETQTAPPIGQAVTLEGKVLRPMERRG